MGDCTDALVAFIDRHPGLCCFQRPAAPSEIAEAEAAVGIEFPEPYRRFLSRFNGGFISLCGHNTEPGWDLESAAWNSNALFGTETLVREYTDQREIWQLDRGWSGAWPYLPFCHTDGQELLVFGPVGAGAGRPVLDAWHEVGPDEWGVVYRGFEDFLAAYVQGEGRVETIGTGP